MPTLADWLADPRTRVDWRVASEWVIALAGGLTARHTSGDCHGSISLDAVGVRSDGSTGQESVALLARSDPHPSFTAPEQIASGAPADPRTDVYSLGVVFYRLLGHRLPFRSHDRGDLAREIVEDDPQPPRQLAIDIPASIERVCLKMLAKDPAVRPADADELVRDLRDALASAEPLDPIGLPLRAARRRDDTARRPSVLVISWQPSEPQATIEPTLSSRVGTTLRRSGSSWIVRPITDPAGGPEPSGMLERTLLALQDLVPTERCGRFVVEVAEDETLKHRSVWVRGRVTPSGVFLEPRSLATVCRWLTEVEKHDMPNGWRVRLGGETHWLFLDADADGHPDRPLVGRAAPLAMLKARWDQACEGLGQTVLLTGEEGTGKTRLVRELHRYATATAADVGWVEWACLPGRETRLGHPAEDYFSDPRNSSADGEQTRTEELTAVSPRDRWHRSLVEWLRALAAAGPTAFAVEDVQWADPETLWFLHALVELELRDRLLVVLTARPEFESPWGSRASQTLIALGRLTKRHAADLYRGVTGTAPPPELVEEVMAATCGIPQSVEGFAEARLRGESSPPA